MKKNSFVIASIAMQQLHAMAPLQKKRRMHSVQQEVTCKSVMNALHSDTPLPTVLCDTVLSYLATNQWRWELSGTCDVGAGRARDSFMSRRVALTNQGLVWSSHACIAHHDHTGEFRELLKNWKEVPGIVRQLVASRPDSEGSSYVAAVVEQSISQGLHNNCLMVWHMPRNAEKTGPPTTCMLATEHDKVCGQSEHIESLIFSSDRDVEYLAAAGYKNITVFRKKENSRTFCLYLCLDPQNKQRGCQVSLSFPVENELVSLYGDTLKHWKLTDIAAPAQACSRITCLNSRLLNSYNGMLLLEPTGYQIALFYDGPVQMSSARWISDVRKPNKIELLLHPRKPDCFRRRRAQAVAYGSNGQIIGGFRDSSIVIWDPKAEDRVAAILDAEQGPAMHTGISSIAMSPNGKVIAVHDFSGLASIFEKTYYYVADERSNLNSLYYPQ